MKRLVFICIQVIYAGFAAIKLNLKGKAIKIQFVSFTSLSLSHEEEERKGREKVNEGEETLVFFFIQGISSVSHLLSSRENE